MAEGFITRKGGKAVGTATPTLNFVSKTDSEIVFTVTNNDTATADIFWEVGDDTPDANQLSLTTGQTSANQTVSGLTQNTQITIFAFANAANKAGSDTVSLTQTTDEITYIDATGGTTETYEDNGTFYKSHTFTSSGNFVVNSLGNVNNELDYLIIAGGAGGGGTTSNNRAAGGGGAGGYRTTLGTSGENSSAESKIIASTGSYTLTVGAGGATQAFNRGLNGANSSVFSITSTGGGSGGGSNGYENGGTGGSGGGGASDGGLGGSRIAGQGFDGGLYGGSNTGGGGGGGGAAQIGEDANSNLGGDGGDGLLNSIKAGSNERRGGGGGGGGNEFQDISSQGLGGAGGGGDGNARGVNTGSAGTANTGGGGGGGVRSGVGYNGGSGIVIIRYEVGEL